MRLKILPIEAPGRPECRPARCDLTARSGGAALHKKGAPNGPNLVMILTTSNGG
jgi:hypothetical protein